MFTAHYLLFAMWPPWVKIYEQLSVMKVEFKYPSRPNTYTHTPIPKTDLISESDERSLQRKCGKNNVITIIIITERATLNIFLSYNNIM